MLLGSNSCENSMISKNFQILAFAMMSLVITIGMTNNAFAEEETLEELEERVQKIISLQVKAENLMERIEKNEIRLQVESISDERKQMLEERLDRLNANLDKTMQRFINLTTNEDGTIDTEALQYASNGGVITLDAVSNYATEFWESAECTHTASFGNPCSGLDKEVGEFGWTITTVPVNIIQCSFGNCIQNVGVQLTAPYTWTYTPVDLFYDKKYSQAYDYVIGQKINQLWLYGSPDTTHFWHDTHLSHQTLVWTVYYYEGEDPITHETKKKTIWVSSMLQNGVNAD